MYNLLLSLGIGIAVFGAVTAWLGVIAGVIPGIATTLVALFFLSRRVGKVVEQEMSQLVPLLQARKVAEAQQRIRSLQARYGRWQFMLEGQLSAQLGMIEYMQMHFDEALPLLEEGKWRNWSALVCIGCIHHRKGRKDQAWEAFRKAASAAPKEVIIYGVWTTLLLRDGKRAEALEVVASGLKQQPDSQIMKELKQKVANKKKVKPQMFGETWYQFFPEDMAQQMMMRGQRGGNPAMQQVAAQQPRFGARHAPRR